MDKGQRMMNHDVIKKVGICTMTLSLISCSPSLIGIGFMIGCVKNKQTTNLTYIPKSFQYEEYGGMENTSYSISYDSEKKKIIVENDYETMKYSVNVQEVNQKIDAFILKYDLTNWLHREAEVIALDAPTERIEIACANGFSFTLNSEEECMCGDENIILKFRELIQTFYQ